MNLDDLHESDDASDNTLAGALIAGFITGVIAAIGIGKLFFTKG